VDEEAPEKMEDDEEGDGEEEDLASAAAEALRQAAADGLELERSENATGSKGVRPDGKRFRVGMSSKRFRVGLSWTYPGMDNPGMATGKIINIGTFDTVEEAALAYARARAAAEQAVDEDEEAAADSAPVLVDEATRRELGLPGGWTTFTRTRKSGGSAGTVNTYYRSPCGKAFPGKPQVTAFVRTARPQNETMPAASAAAPAPSAPVAPAAHAVLAPAPAQSLSARMGALETALIGQTQEGPAFSRITALETAWFGKEEPGPFAARIAALEAAIA
jgi:hypothetical protein